MAEAVQRPAPRDPQLSQRPGPYSTSFRFGLGGRRRADPNNLDGETIGLGAVEVRLIRNIPDVAARFEWNGIFGIDLVARADPHGSGQDGDESIIRMRVGLAPI